MDRKKFLRDERAVSPVLGFILIVAVGISMLTYVQVHSVPVWNTEIELDHVDAVYEEMMYMASDIEDVAISGVPKSSDIPLGVEYPSRGIFRNPRPGMVGTLSVSSDQAVTINYTLSGVAYNKTYSSCSIRYTASGTTMHPTLVYEHGIVVRDYGEYGNSTPCEQTLLSGDNINLVISNGSYSSSSMETGRLPIYYNAESETVSGNITNVTITITTNYTNIWRNLLEGKNTTNTTVSFSENKIIITSTAIEEISLPEMWSSFSGIYAGMITFSTEVIEEGGDGGVGGYSGTGGGIMTSGTQWWDIPSSTAITKINISNIVVDQAPVAPADLGDDIIMIIVTDSDNDWWKMVIEFGTPDEIKSIIARSGTTSNVSTYQGTPIVFDSTTVIDLLPESNYDRPDACYQNAEIGDDNIVVTYLGDEVSLKKTVLISYRMTVE